ncbi:hypothetical protein [Streptomyces sp. NPDC001933]|uniref:hypothetical protein n=1 Tax=Streptomyces sp. NPDC001933 TaxID=3364626 RepID=UPI00368B04C9
MLQRAIDAGIPFAWVIADEAYGKVKHTRLWLEERGVAYVLATEVNDTVITAQGRESRVDALVAVQPHQRWKRLSGGARPGLRGSRCRRGAWSDCARRGRRRPLPSKTDPPRPVQGTPPASYRHPRRTGPGIGTCTTRGWSVLGRPRRSWVRRVSGRTPRLRPATGACCPPPVGPARSGRGR